MKSCTWTGMVMAALFGAALSAHAAPRYELVEVAPLSTSREHEPRAINNADEVIGGAIRPNSTFQPVRFTRGGVRRLILRTDLPYRRGSASALSDAGHVAGHLLRDPEDDAMFIAHGGTTTLYSFPFGTVVPSGINSQGQAVGYRQLPGLPPRAFVMQDGRWTDLPVLQPELSSNARAINESGQIVGEFWYSADGVNTRRGALWQDGELKQTFGLPGSLDSGATAINRQGWIAGYSRPGADSFKAHAFIHRDGITTDLDTNEQSISYATGINAAGEVVGDRTLADRSGPFIYTGGRMRWLADLLPAAQLAEWRLWRAYGINDAGHVIATAFDTSGRLRAVMLRRLPAQAATR